MPPRVSVNTVAKNAASTIGEAIESILGQSFQDFEHVLVDDGSTDGTRAILEKMQGDAELTLIFRDRNGGKGAALRAGLEKDREGSEDPQYAFGAGFELGVLRLDYAYCLSLHDTNRMFSNLHHCYLVEFLTG